MVRSRATVAPPRRTGGSAELDLWHYLWPSNLERLPWSIRDELRNDQQPHDNYGATVQAAAAGNSAVLLVLPMRPYEAQTTLKKTMACRLAW